MIFRIRRNGSQSLRPQSLGLQDVPELLGKFGVPVVKYKCLPPIPLRQVHAEIPSLLRDPGRIGVRCG